MKNIAVIVFITILFTVTVNGVRAQQDAPKGTLEVVAVKGNVSFEETRLKKGDQFVFTSGSDAMEQLMFDGEGDWIRIMEIDAKKVHIYYKKKKDACANCLFTRGDSDNPSINALHDYLSRKPVFIVDADTLIFRRRPGSIINTVLFRIYANGEMAESIVGNSDTMIISHNSLFGNGKSGRKYWPSFQADSIVLVHLNEATSEKTIPPLPAFQVIFLDDAVRYFRKMKMNKNEIYVELSENYIDMEDLTSMMGFEDENVTELWLKDRIESSLASKR